MKKILLLLSMVSILFASDCSKEDDECHRIISVHNNSDSTVFIGDIARYASDNLCYLSAVEIESTSSYEFTLLRSCWEKRLIEGKIKEIYIVAPSNFNEQGKFYDCDSIELMNTILRKYELNLKALEASNFIVNYP